MPAIQSVLHFAWSLHRSLEDPGPNARGADAAGTALSGPGDFHHPIADKVMFSATLPVCLILWWLLTVTGAIDEVLRIAAANLLALF